MLKLDSSGFKRWEKRDGKHNYSFHKPDSDDHNVPGSGSGSIRERRKRRQNLIISLYMQQTLSSNLLY